MAWSPSLSRSSWSDSNWQDTNNSPLGTVGADSNPLLNHPFRKIRFKSFRVSVAIEIVTTPMSSLATSVTQHSIYPVVLESWTCRERCRNLALVDVTRKGLDDYVLRTLSDGEFQSVVFARSVSEAVFATTLLRLLRQDKVDRASVWGCTPR